MSGICDFIDSHGIIEWIDYMQKGYDEIKKYNKLLADEAGIPPSIALTTIKPSGTTSNLSNVSPGIHPRLFKQYMNSTPFQYITKYRFNIALSLIKRDYSLGEVALQVGYSDIASFSHAFKRIYGISPSVIKHEYMHSTLVSSK